MGHNQGQGLFRRTLRHSSPPRRADGRRAGTLRGRRRPRAGERGQSLVLVALFVTSLLGAGGVALDGGQLYVARTNAQRTGDAAALAGARTVLTNANQGITDAKAYAASNFDGSAQATVSTTTRSNDTITVTSTKSVSTSFLKAVGIFSGTVNATAKAQVGPAGSATGILPWAVNDDSFSGYNVSVGLQAANANGGCGNFNYVSITPPGGQTYADAIVNGVNQPILLNTSYPTNTSDGSGVSATTKAAFQARINARPNETASNFAPGSPRVAFIPVLNGNIPNAPSPVQATSFRAIFLESVDNNCVYGRFVQAAIPVGGIGGVTVPDKGVHVIKLIG